ncbi:hypothetical protein LUZ60_008107 [Juncus effusus]|nr:hypothetical protein LUZ60_008107 [Juncus effusus]
MSPPPSPPPPPLHAFALPSPLSISSLLASPPPFTSLALFLSDSTALLSPSLAFTPVTLPPPSFPSLSAFVKPSNNSLVFLSFTPSKNPVGYVLKGNGFSPVGVCFKEGLLSVFQTGVLGFSVKSSNNMLVIHSIGVSQIWLLFVELKDNVGGKIMVELKKCAVIQLVNPVYEMCVGFGCLILGEKDGIRVFKLRPLVKGKEGKERKGNEKKGKSLLNGVVDVSVSKNETKLRALKIKQNARDYSFFMTFRDDKNKNPINAVSIRPFSKKTLLVLDSTGDLHFFSLKGNSGDFSAKLLEFNMKVRILAVLPNFSSKSQIFYVSDGGYLLNKVSAENELASLEISGTETIFTGERIKDIVPVSNNSVLVLTQGNLFVYEEKMFTNYKALDVKGSST